MAAIDEPFVYTYKNEEVDSSAIKALWYSLSSRRLVVEYPSGALAGYQDVTPELLKSVLNNYSIGSAFNRYIKVAKTGFSTPYGLKFVPYNRLSDSNTNPAIIGDPAHRVAVEVSEDIYDEPGISTYEIDFTIEGVAEFRAPSGDVMAALEKFLGDFAQRDAKVRVRSIKEIV